MKKTKELHNRDRVTEKYRGGDAKGTFALYNSAFEETRKGPPEIAKGDF